MGLLVADENARDLSYRNLMGDAAWAKNARVYVEELYSITSDVLDKKFQQQAKANLHGCYAEMYFAAVCRDRLSMSISHPSDEGLDFLLNDLACWVECVAATNGTCEENSIPTYEEGVVYNFPERQFLLRLSSVFYTKSNKIIKDIGKGLVKINQPVVVFVNVGALDDRFSIVHHPPMFDVLLGLGNLKFLIDGETRQILKKEYEYKKSVERVGGKEEIEIGFFLDQNFSHVSAVIYSYADFANPFKRTEWGRDFFILHNPLAKNKLPYGFLPCGNEFYVDINSDCYSIVKYKQHDSDYESLNYSELGTLFE